MVDLTMALFTRFHVSSIMRRCTRKYLFSGENELYAKGVLSSLCVVIEFATRKNILKIGDFILCHPKIKKIFKYIFRCIPALRKKIEQLYYTHPKYYSSSAILNTARLSPKAESIYKLLSK